MKFKLSQSSIILSVGYVILFALCIYPFAILIQKIIWIDGKLTFKYFIDTFNNQSTIKAIFNTIWVSIATSIIGLLMALPMSWLLTRTNLKNANRWRSLFCLPYAIPPYIGAIAWIYLANPSNGIINIIFKTNILNIYSFTGLVWVMASSLYAFILLSLLAALDRMDPSLEEAARLSGARPIRVFKDITLPLIRPAMLSGILLVMLAAAASFGVPALIGNPASIYLVTTRIYTFQKMGSLSGIYQSGALSTILLFLAVITLVINQVILRKANYQTVSGKSARPSLIDLGRYHLLINWLLRILFSVLFVLPIIGIIITALNKKQGLFAINNFGMQNFIKLFTEIPETPTAFLNSTILAVGSAVICCIIAMILSYIQWKTKIKGRQSVEVIASLPYSTPGTVLALAFILSFSSNLFGLPIPLYNTLLLIGLVYISKYLNFAIRTIGDGYRQIDDALAEAARVSGASWLKTLMTIWFPLMKPSLVASFFLILMPAFSELTMTILLTGPGLETVGTVLFQLQEYADASGGGSAVLALVIILVVASSNFLVRKISRGKYGL